MLDFCVTIIVDYIKRVPFKWLRFFSWHHSDRSPGFLRHRIQVLVSKKQLLITSVRRRAVTPLVLGVIMMACWSLLIEAGSLSNRCRQPSDVPLAINQSIPHQRQQSMVYTDLPPSWLMQLFSAFNSLTPHTMRTALSQPWQVNTVVKLHNPELM